MYTARRSLRHLPDMLVGFDPQVPIRCLSAKPVSVIDLCMNRQRTAVPTTSSVFTGEAVRALFSTLLLLGLSGDRRAR